ncbi:hypothetical protein LCGC14_0668000 [marine sediment metagenome]|uniref:Uncharacterized protein n=1 Tax=marine sediment metagenome TaxID=412755 RepID=A0A0F9QWU9_9ZZZZ
MLLSEFKQKYSNLIIEYEEENPDKHAIWHNDFTKSFISWLQKKNIKITYKYIKIKAYNKISEFFLNYLKEHAYLSKKALVGIYKDTIHPPVEEFKVIKREFSSLINYHLKYGVLEHYSLYTFKINKNLVN